MKKKIFLYLICSIIILGITGCTDNSKKSESTPKKEENTKINLNDNIEVTLNTKSTGTPDCFFYMFANNLQEIFPNAKINDYDGYHFVAYWIGPAVDASDGEITEEGLQNNINSLQFNNKQEKTITDLFQKYQKKTYTGIKNIEYNFENHRLSFSYDYLVFKNNDYKTDGETLDSEVQQILLDATRFNGTCGGFDFNEDTILTENLCNEYNLNCDRW